MTAELAERFDRIESKLDAIETAIRGNGGPGLLTRMEVMEQICDERQGRCGGGVANYKLLGIVATLAGAVGGLVGVLAKLI